MNRSRTVRVGALALMLSLPIVSACEDPIILIGDLPGIVRRVAGIPNSVGTAVGSFGNQTQLHLPVGVTTARDGTLYIADTGNSRIVAVSPAGRASVVASDVGCSDACLVAPEGIDVHNDGSVWIADPGANRIFRLDPATGALEVRAGTGVAGSSPDGTPVLEADLARPTGLVVNADGVVYFSEWSGHRIRWLQGGATIRTLAGTGEPGYADGSPATNARLNGPRGLTIGGSTLYFADEQNNRVRAVTLGGGNIRNIAGNGHFGYEDTDRIASTTELAKPRSVTVTPDGTQLFIADADNHRVRVVNLETGRITTFAGTGDQTFNGEGLGAGATSLDRPSGVTVHSDGTLFIADTGHQIVWRTPLRF